MGRPRAFDIDQALDQALLVFWRKGYEATTLADLQQAMGINRPSLYAAFGNKEALFRKALDRYAAGPTAYFEEVLNQPTARAVAESFFREVIDMAANPKNPRGCMWVKGLLTCEGASADLRAAMAAHRKTVEAALRRRFERAKKELDLPATVDPANLARYVQAVVFGMSIQVTGGATKRNLQSIAEIAMRAWPE